MTHSQYQQYIQSVIIYPRKSREDIERERETGEDCLTIMTEVLVNTVDRLKTFPIQKNDIMSVTLYMNKIYENN